MALEEKASTPEKKLLQIIEGSNGSIGVKGKAVKEYKRAAIFSPAAFKGNISFLLNSVKAKFTKDALLSFDIRKLNLILMFATVLLIVFSMLNVLRYHKDAGRIIKLTSADLKEQSVPGGLLSSQNSGSIPSNLAAFLEKVRARDLFKPFVSRPKTTDDVSMAKLKELVKNLRLAGISLSVNPDESYAFIEDVDKKESFFVRPNEFIPGLNVKVTDIQADKIIINYEDKYLEIK